ncbi:MAG TPA: hypothetical protein VMM76_19330 [Pirellulaceae bacterium]|nr:hypothetical protein [Pirellulaceae bacterium]
MRSRLFVFVLFALAFPLPATSCSSLQARGDGGANDRPLVAWRRTALGWEDASRWQLNATLRPLPTSTAAVHPLVIASLELMLSVGVLILVAPSPRL